MHEEKLLGTRGGSMRALASPYGWPQSREAAGFLVVVIFVCLAALRDMYLSGLWQRVNPLQVAVVCSTAYGVRTTGSISPTNRAL